MPQPTPDEPEKFGYQPDNSYAPAPVEIARLCARIREGWSEREKARRAAWALPVRVELTEQNARDWGQ